MQRKSLLFYFFLFTLPFWLARCANPVTPEGGPKDLTPPKVEACDPPNFSTNFSGNSFKIEFDEFINLKNAASEVFISPPLKKPLDPRLRGKSLVLKFEDSLVSNLTYSVNFGNALSDFTENNILKGFNYVFSTGSYVDSLSLQGTLVNAFDLKPQKDVFIQLYLNNNDTLPLDSLPLHVAPYYLTKTDDNGLFIFNNLQDKPFKLFALADQNGDLIFNQPSEKIAFRDSMVKPYYISRQKVDTTIHDSLLLKPETTLPPKKQSPEMLRKADSIKKVDSLKQNRLLYPSYPLYLFEETDSIQRLVKSAFPVEGMALFTFRFPVKKIRFVSLNFDSITPWYIEEYSTKRDSVMLWITRPKTDTLFLRVTENDNLLDTVNLELIRKETPKKKEKQDSPTRLILTSAIKGNALNQYKYNPVFNFSYPLSKWDFSRVLLIEKKDTLHPVVEFLDSVKRKIVVRHKWIEDQAYKMIIPDSIFVSVNNLSHDTLRLEFRTKSEREFGNLILTMNIDNRPGQYIIQLINEKESIIFEEQIVTQSGKIRFNYLVPGKYKIKAILDRNKNMHWDTGNYKKNLQPEEVQYYPKTVEIRGNWDLEEIWD